ncbi:MAG: hypothetical protein Q7S00_07625, partial [bacterium]|nr:hypothetical protein [bacterium]
ESIETAARASAQATERIQKSFMGISAQSQGLAADKLNLQEKYGFLGRKKKGEVLNEEPVFVPWYTQVFSRRSEKALGRPRWYWVFVYSTITVVIVTAVMIFLKIF